MADDRFPPPRAGRPQAPAPDRRPHDHTCAGRTDGPRRKETMPMPLFTRLAAIPLALSLLAGCSAPPAPQPPIPAVKTAVAQTTVSAFSRDLSGVVEAQESTFLSFPVGGTVSEVAVDVGDEVRPGQVLAALDPTPLDNRVRTALARVRSAQAEVLKAKDQHQRLSTLFSQGFVSKSEIDDSRAALEAARGGLEVARGELEDAQRDRARTAIVAPYAGVIAKKSVQAFQEVQPGTTLFELAGKGGLKVRVMAPETLIADIRPGDPARVSFAAVKNLSVQGLVAEISAVAETGNAFPVTVALDSPPEGVRIGMTAQVALGTGQGAAVFLLPMTALALNEVPRLAAGGGPGDKAPVFIFDPEQQAVTLRLVDVLDIQGNFLAVTRGLAPGEEVVVAGTAFLRDGMRVRRWTPDTPQETVRLGTVAGEGE
jgi:RND family efflux transporter MFP subunit